MIKVGIVGISGYSGVNTLEILLKHPGVRVTYVSANNTKGRVSEIWPHLKGKVALTCTPFDIKKAVKLCDVVFLAVPHTVAMTIAPALLAANIKVIDFSGDYRLKNTSDYKKWYGTEHKDSGHLKQSVYGLPELYRANIKKAKLIANPGCYPTAAILTLAPLIAAHSKNCESIVIDAKSGVSGAGRRATLNFSFTEVNENFKAYKVLKHQHAPEIDLYLSKISTKPVSVNFVPHLLPVTRGILETIYVHLKKRLSVAAMHKMYTRFYKNEPFIRILPLGQQPELKHVVKTNYCDIALAMSNNNKLLVLTSTIDNLLKGAAGQAVQNMNLMCGFKETESLL